MLYMVEFELVVVLHTDCVQYNYFVIRTLIYHKHYSVLAVKTL